VKVDAGPEMTISADRDQLEQLLINLVRNAVDATLESGGKDVVRIGWLKLAEALEVRVQDSGPGLADSANLFVPFFTTKPTGTGLGLVLCRQIAEAHGGSVVLENRVNEPGCVARVRLPIA
jgi:signal transduction histidine kinase